MGHEIMVIGDDRDDLERIISQLTAAGFTSVEALGDARKAAARFESQAVVDVALIDLGGPEMSGQSLLALIKGRSPATACIVVTTVNDARTALQCMRQGAYDYLVKPVAEDELVSSVRRALEHLQSRGAEKRPGAAVPREQPAVSLAEVERRHILEVYRQLGCNKVRAARALGVGLNTLRRKLKSYEIK
jgi:DNA-binding NtrC family response regulator